MSMPASASWKTEAQAEAVLRDFASDVRAGLSKRPQKELHSKYFYDDLGSALFDAITFLPEYGLTRADERLLSSCADQMAGRAGGPLAIVELGSGSGGKTRHLLEAVRRRQPEVLYQPIDVSPAALARCERELSGIAEVRPILHSYLDGMAEAVSHRSARERLLVLFLGSTIGNFERPMAASFLSDLRAILRRGDFLLVGADLVKEPERMLLAYDDPTGVTAAFNLNLIGRVNRQLGGDFDLRAFEHQARWNAEERRIEMHLRSRKEQTVTIRDAGCAARLQDGETIWTESSHKFETAGLARMAAAAGFRVDEQWVDREWPFVESLWEAV